MARRKITEMDQLTSKGLRGYRAIWAHVLTFENNLFTITDIDSRTNAARPTVRDYLNRLVKAGYLKILTSNHENAKLFKLVKPVKDAPRLRRNGEVVTQGSGRDHMWRTIKMMGTFTPKDLAISASTAEVQIKENSAKDYIKFLHFAGYLKCVKTRTNHKSGGQAQYRLLPNMNTGPKAPVIQRIKSVYDPNRQEVMWPKNAEGQS